jgi:hypothetical protein
VAQNAILNHIPEADSRQHVTIAPTKPLISQRKHSSWTDRQSGDISVEVTFASSLCIDGSVLILRRFFETFPTGKRKLSVEMGYTTLCVRITRCIILVEVNLIRYRDNASFILLRILILEYALMYCVQRVVSKNEFYL